MLKGCIDYKNHLQLCFTQAIVWLEVALVGICPSSDSCPVGNCFDTQLKQSIPQFSTFRRTLTTLSALLYFALKIYKHCRHNFSVCSKAHPRLPSCTPKLIFHDSLKWFYFIIYTIQSS